MSGRACGRTALVPHRLWAWPTRPDADHALAWKRPWPAEVAVPDPCPPHTRRVRHTLAMSATAAAGPLRVRAAAGRREAARHPSKRVRPPRTPAWPPSPACRRLPDTNRPDGGRSGSSGRSIRRSLRLVTTSSTLPSRPACGRQGHHWMRPPGHLHSYFFTVAVMQSLISTCVPSVLITRKTMSNGSRRDQEGATLARNALHLLRLLTL
jgi:hypothetical protein